MKKIRAFILALLAATVAMAPLSSCSSDDNDDNNNGGNTELPKYAALAAQYIIDDEQAAVKSIELTESGRYLVEMNRSYSGAPKRAAGNDNGMYYGTYTASADHLTFTLEGFGTMKVNDNGTVTITSDKTGGTATWKATAKKGELQASKGKGLCRTWTVKTIRMYAKVGNRTGFDVTANSLPELYLKLKEKGIIGDDEDDEEQDWDSFIKWARKNNPVEYTFTSTGLVFVKTIGNGTQAYNRWRMKSANEMQIWNSTCDKNENGKPDDDEWSVDLFGGVEGEGHLIVSLKGNKLVIDQTETVQEEINTTTGYTYTFEEAK